MSRWIPAGALAAAVARSVLGALAAQRDNEIILIAEDTDGTPLGFLYGVVQERDLAGNPVGYISELAVTAEAEGQGVGHALLAAIEQWGRDRGLLAMTVEVFWDNTRARTLYEHMGYAPNVLDLRKPLAPDP